MWNKRVLLHLYDRFFRIDRFFMIGSSEWHFWRTAATLLSLGNSANKRTISMFRTVLSFCWMLARGFSCAMSGKFVNVSAAFAAISYYKKNYLVQNKIHQKVMLFRRLCTEFFLCNVVWSLLVNIAPGFYLCNVVPIVLRKYWTKLFHVQCCLEPLGPCCTRYFSYTMLSQEY